MMAWSLSLALAGFTALALAMHRHHGALPDVRHGRPRSGLLRCAGVVLLAVSYDCLRQAWGTLEGTIDWLCLASIAAISTVYVLAAGAALWQHVRGGGGRPGR